MASFAERAHPSVRAARCTSLASLASVAWVASLVLTACGDDPIEERATCAFGDEHVLATARGGFDEVRIAPSTNGALAVWSTLEGTYARALDRAGAARSAARRMGGRCEAGLFAGPTERGVLVACLRLPEASQDKPGAVALFVLDDDARVTLRRTVPGVGRGSRGVSAAELAAGRLVVAWSDGEARAVLRVDIDGDEVSPAVEVSRHGTSPGPPSLYVDGAELLCAWSETVVDPMSGSTIGEVLLDDGHGAPRRFASVLYEDARPVVTRDAHGLVLGYRDENPSGSRVAFFAQRIDERLARQGEPTRIGRSDAASGADLFPCKDGLFAVAAHSYGRHEALVGISRLDEALERVGGERQIYTADAKYEHGVGLCADDAALVVVAERAPSPSDDASLKAITLHCR